MIWIVAEMLTALVKLSLMTVEESIDLLSFGAGLSEDKVPAEIVEVVALCGRYAHQTTRLLRCLTL